eukprot:2343467-Rhodomonas_salina.3
MEGVALFGSDKKKRVHTLRLGDAKEFGSDSAGVLGGVEPEIRAGSRHHRSWLVLCVHRLKAYHVSTPKLRLCSKLSLAMKDRFPANHT